MKYIQEKNGKREIVTKPKHSRAYFVQAVIKWFFCIGILVLTVLLCQFLDKKLNDGKIVEKIRNAVSGSDSPKDTELSLFEEETETEIEERGLRVCIDPGHGGMDPGCDYNGRLESDDNWKLALSLKTELEAAGIDVVMTREDNTTKVFLKDRVKIANASGADYFISLHRNKGDGYGIETWMTANSGQATEELTNNVHNAIVSANVQRDRGVKVGTETGEGSDYYVLGNTTMPACLIEFGFINNEEDNRLYDGLHGKRLTYPTIDNVSALSTEILNWGQGSNVDEYNRPTDTLGYNEKYKNYTADFVIPTTEKKIYLTLDEGYEYGCTPTILSTLKEKNVKAVFFVTKPYVESQPDYIRQMIDDGHIVGNHSVTHPSAGIPSLSVENQTQEVMGLHDYIKQNYDYDMYLFRFPAGKFSEQSLAVLNNCGYRSVFWSFAYLDYDVENQPDEQESLQKMLDKLHPGAIYLLHAESWTNTNVLGQFIDKAREAGYEFALYSETIQ